ncbi:transposase [Paraglaciecola psychrophila]|jgi:transposase|uniref:Transposase, IS911 n=1 Tax=Paraglaciecola psychrophila 170 TaxID=1129794 RepID=K7ACY3_9ALTE|nr:transposase [Paraglaciecola psychrophila]AGH42393.1 transposase, IS911 [Paraglaciecola psychrophila 170]GAC40127.1 transposase IS911 [Paraglaciecola psychrophila 170]
MTARKKYSKEFKLDAIALVIEQRYSRVEAATNLGITAQILGRWLKEAEDDNGHAFRGNGTLTPEQAKILSLKGQVKRLEMERERLTEQAVKIHQNSRGAAAREPLQVNSIKTVKMSGVIKRPV